MAMFDNSEFLLKHIRNSFIVSDGTGICEQLLEKDETSRKIRDKLIRGPLASDDEDARSSPDIEPDMDFGSRRRRSNTQHRLERMNEEKQRQLKTKHIPWKMMHNNDFADEDLDDLFGHMIIPPVTSHVSALTNQMQCEANQPVNPFTDYAVFDGRSLPSSLTKRTDGPHVKKLDIFLPGCEVEADLPMPVTVIARTAQRVARIRDLIGLVCWQYTVDGKQPALIPSVCCYSLYMVDEDDQVEEDFAPLSAKEPVSKFDFAKLALVQTKELSEVEDEKQDNSVFVHISGKGFVEFSFPSLCVELKQLYDKALEVRGASSYPGVEYNLEKHAAPGVKLRLEDDIITCGTNKFCLVRENAQRSKDTLPADSEHTLQMEDERLEASFGLHYNCYKVLVVHKPPMSVSTKDPVNLAIAGNKVEVNAGSRKTKFLRSVSATYDAEQIKLCKKLDSKPNGKSTFRLECLLARGSSSSKLLTFEADSLVADEIVQRINAIARSNRSSTLDRSVTSLQIRTETPQKQKKRLSLSVLFS